MCKYCENNYLVTDHKSKDGATAMYVSRGNIEVYWRADDPYYNDAIKVGINFCPMCGRKLSEEEREYEERI